MLEQLLSLEVFGLFLVFARIGSAFMLLPGFAEAYVAMRVRLMLAGAISVILGPVLAPILPALPAEPLGLVLLLVGEIGLGLFLGLAARMILAALQTAGMIIALQTGLANAFTFDPAAGIQGALAGAWLSTTALVLIFVTDSHHTMLRGLAHSYVVFQPGALPPIADLTEAMTRLFAESFKLAVQISAPFLVFGLVFFLALGLLNRLMPQVQVFFVAMPAQIALGLLVLALTITAAMTGFLGRFEAAFAQLLPS